jgi:hypothetical protein
MRFSFSMTLFCNKMGLPQIQSDEVVSERVLKAASS